MKTFSLFLIFISIAFAIAALFAALVNGEMLRRQSEALAPAPTAVVVVSDPQPEPMSEPDPTSSFMTIEPASSVSELGFGFTAPEDWGAFSLEYFPADNAPGSYYGTFENQPGLTFISQEPLIDGAPGREFTLGDVKSFRLQGNTYYIGVPGRVDIPVPQAYLNVEIDTVNTTVLVLNGQEFEGSTVFPTDPDIRAAILPLPGPLQGGIWTADETVSRADFRAFLESLELISYEEDVE